MSTIIHPHTLRDDIPDQVRGTVTFPVLSVPLNVRVEAAFSGKAIYPFPCTKVFPAIKG